MATAYSSYGKPASFNKAMFIKSLYGIMRASRSITAFGAYPWRND
jgi:hypothetical protein